MKNYRKELHDAVNGFPVIEICTLVYLTDPQGNLILQRAKDDIYWKLPGGFLTPEESVKKCLQRNILDNYGILIERCSLLKVFSGPGQSFISDDSARICPLYMTFFPTRIRGSLRTQPADGSEIRFFASWNIPTEKIFPPMRNAVQYFIDTFPGGAPVDSFDLERYPEVSD